MGELLAPDISLMLQSNRQREAREALLNLMEPEIADVIDELEGEEQLLAFRLLPRARAVEVFEYLETELQETLIRDLGNEHVAQLINEMDPDDRVELFEDIDEEESERLLKLMHPQERRETRMMMEFPEESIGRIMTTDFLSIQPHWTAQEVLDFVRQNARDAETLDTLYVVDKKGRLQDELRLRQILLADPQRKVAAMMDQQVTALSAGDDREEAVRTMERYDRPVLPVVDDYGKLVGVVTFDDVADVAEEEVTEDMHKMGGMAALDMPYMSATIMTLVRKRVVWLMVLFVGGLLTVTAMGAFEAQIEKLAILALFIPLVIATGGNSGTQAASLVIRALAIGEIDLRDWYHVARRELCSGLLMGSILGIIGMGVATTVAAVIGAGSSFHDFLQLGFTIGTAIVGVVIVGSLLGAMLPFIMSRLGFDPATSSTPFIATLVDATGLVIYFSCAIIILGV